MRSAAWSCAEIIVDGGFAQIERDLRQLRRNSAAPKVTYSSCSAIAASALLRLTAAAADLAAWILPPVQARTAGRFAEWVWPLERQFV